MYLTSLMIKRPKRRGIHSPAAVHTDKQHSDGELDTTAQASNLPDSEEFDDNENDEMNDVGNDEVSDDVTPTLHNLSNITDILGQNEIDINSSEALDHCLNQNVSDFSAALPQATSTLTRNRPPPPPSSFSPPRASPARNLTNNIQNNFNPRRRKPSELNNTTAPKRSRIPPQETLVRRTSRPRHCRGEESNSNIQRTLCVEVGPARNNDTPIYIPYNLAELLDTACAVQTEAKVEVNTSDFH